MIGGTATAQNVLLQNAPQGSWQATTKLDVSTLTTSGDQAGFILWKQREPEQLRRRSPTSPRAPRSSTSGWRRINGVSDIHAGPSIAARPTDAYLRLSANGAGTFIAEGSSDGETWVPISTPITGLGDPRR